jgi:DNA-binding NarL/FixJ family response regulator
MSIRVLIADDHVFYREGVRALLSDILDIQVLGEAATGEEAIARALEWVPDIILMDLKMPGLNGIEATRRIMQTHPETGILVITMFDDDDSVFAAMRAGARGYLLKDADREELVRAITAVQRGEAIFSPAIAQRMIQYFSMVRPSGGALQPADRGQAEGAFAELTEREREILDLIAQGHNNAAIANRLFLSVKTVQNYVSNILSKLQVVDRSQAIVRARQAGYGQEKKA